ncbi:MAG: A/G-specific adenine glycosylase [Chitinophagaceae bacterium]|nr:MAG: A/G-specific adenine glycosylase [Chitinophagaceae bacterium]
MHLDNMEDNPSEGKNKKLFFTKELMHWEGHKKRLMPWKYEKDPYKIWLSEIILQQTRVEQGKSYYNKFISNYPDVDSLANTPIDNVLKDWEGLGYYSRAKNLHTAANQIVKEYNSNFPDNFEDILKLKGVGTYTASAISSFAFNIPKAVLDGNVIRILARYFGIGEPYNKASTKRNFQKLADELIDMSNPAKYNQLIMDYGALICKPTSPDCENCVLQPKCFAFQNDNIKKYPVKIAKAQKKKRYFYYFIIENGEEIVLNKRSEKDVWSGLYDFPHVEYETEQNVEKACEDFFTIQKLENISMKDTKRAIFNYKQTLSHQFIFSFFIRINELQPQELYPNYHVVKKNILKKMPFPKTIAWYFKKCYLTLIL